MAHNEAAMKQASSASAAAKKFMNDAGTHNSTNKDEVEKLQSEVNTLKEGRIQSKGHKAEWW